MDDHLSGEARVERSGYDRRGFLARTAAGAAAIAGTGALGGVPGLDLASAFAAPVKGGTLNVGIGQVFEDINVITAIGYRWGQLMAYAMYDTLVKYDSTGKAVPLLATSWKIVDPKTTMVTIRKGVKFHSGKDLTVDDVVWSLNRIHDTKQPVSNNFLALPADIWGAATKVDDSTLKIVTKKPTRMVENWRFWFIMPADSDNTSLGVTPNGTGPFKYKNFVKGDRLELEGFTDYWNGDKPYLANLTFKFLADETAQIANFLSNTINYLHDISVASLPQVQGKNNSKLIPSGLFFEWWQPQMYKGPLADVKVRRALMYAFDRKKDNQIAWAGKGIDTWNPFQKTPYYIGKKWPVSYDPERAKSELAKAGQPNLKLNMMILQEPGPWHRESQVLQQGFVKAGVKASIQTLPSAQWFDRLYTKRNHDGIAVNAGTVPFPWALIANYMLKATLLKPPTAKKAAIPKLEAAYNVAFSSATEAQYKASLQTVQKLMLSEAAVYHTMIANNQNIAPQNLLGVDSTLIGDQRFDGAYFSS